MRARRAILVCSVMLVFTGGVVVARPAQDVRYAWASLNWPSVLATVTWSRISKTGRVEDGKGSHQPSALRAVEVGYRYVVNGKEFNSTKVSFGGFYLVDRLDEKGELTHYREGTRLEVWYDPTDPHSAVLVPGMSPDIMYMKLVPGLLCLFAGTLLAVGAIRWRGRGEAARLAEGNTEGRGGKRDVAQ